MGASVWGQVWQRAAAAAGTAVVLVLLLLGLEGVLLLLDHVDRALRGWLDAPEFLANCAFLYLHIALLGAVIALLELWRPGSRAPRRYGQALLFWALYVPVAVLAADLGNWAAAALGIEPLVDLRVSDFEGEGGAGAQVLLHGAFILLAAVVFDFFYYWFHRLQHAVPWLWAFHSAHHANRSLNALGCYHHPVEDLLRIPFFVLPMAFASDIQAPELFLVTAFVTAWGLFNHADTRFSLGPLRWVFADNHYHRIHHALTPEFHGRNFAGMFSPWDRLFGTQRMPHRGVETLPVGLSEQPHPATAGEFLLQPLHALWPGGKPADSPVPLRDE